MSLSSDKNNSKSDYMSQGDKRQTIIKDTVFSPESGVKMDNIKQYALYLREIRYAIDNDVKEDFDRIIALLEKSPMIV